MEVLFAILLALGMGIALRPRARPRRALLPAEAEASSKRGQPALLEASIEHVDALTEVVQGALGAGLPALEAVMRDQQISHRARGALLWLRLKNLEADEAAYMLRTLLDNPELRQAALHAAIEVAADGDEVSSRRLLDALEFDRSVAEVARPVVWALLVAGPYDVERRCLDLMGQVGLPSDAQDIFSFFGQEPELHHVVRATVQSIHTRHGAHALSIVDPEGEAPTGRLSLAGPSDDSEV